MLNKARQIAGDDSLAGKDASWAKGAKRVIEQTFLDIDREFEVKKHPKHRLNESR